jgi:hypothetical protein
MQLGAMDVCTTESAVKSVADAQAQCRSTWEAIAEIKNPRQVAFVNQANISAGPQQVNNGVAPPEQPSRTEETGNAPNKLLEVHDGERLDTRAPGTTGGVSSQLEAVGAIDRAEDGKR